jgi:hypothetical protein
MDSDGLFWGYGSSFGTDKVVVVINRGTASRTRTVSTGALGLSDGTVLTDVIHGGTKTIDGGSVSVTLGARDAAVLVVE